MDRLGITVFGCQADEAELLRELAPGFGVVPTITGAPASAASAIAVAGNRCISVDHKTRISGPDLRALADAGVAYVSSRSTGIDHIDGAAAEALGITVEGVAYAPDGVADFTLLLLLMALRNARAIGRAVDRHDFRLPAERARDLGDLTVGVVGMGAIGTAVLRRLQGFGCRVLTSTSVPLDDLLRRSDVVTLHVPLTAATHHLIGADQLAAMKPGAVLVNTGRGALVDTDALLAALEHGRLGGAALDVVEGEDGIFYADRSTTPVEHRSLLRLLARPDVVVTPHVAYFTRRALHDTVEGTLANCLTFERNRTDGQTEDRDLVRGLLGGA